MKKHLIILATLISCHQPVPQDKCIESINTIIEENQQTMDSMRYRFIDMQLNSKNQCESQIKKLEAKIRRLEEQVTINNSGTIGRVIEGNGETIIINNQ